MVKYLNHIGTLLDFLRDFPHHPYQCRSSGNCESLTCIRDNRRSALSAAHLFR